MPTLRPLAWLVAFFFPALALAAAPRVTAIRCPDGGVQPQAAVDGGGKIHLIYLKGDEAKSDVFYVTSVDGGKTWGKPLRVNSHAGSAIVIGTVRGAQLALGRGGRPHVAWMGSDIAEPRGPGGATPMCYARLNDAGDAFEPQRNLITMAPGLDGGGSIAADGAGHVYVAWHAPIPGMRGEQNRTVWLATSADDGRTFAPEKRMTDADTGACGCCGMRLGVDSKGELIGVYRAVNPQSRDIHLLAGKAGGGFISSEVQAWATKACPVSTASVASAGGRTLVAWETAGQVQFARVEGDKLGQIVAAPGKGMGRKHPSVAIDADGVTLLAWAEGTGWKKGGSVAWQVYDASLNPVAGASGRLNDLGVWSLPTAVNVPGGRFLIVY